MARKKRLVALLLLVVIVGAGGSYVARKLEPMPAGAKRFVRWEKSVPIESVLKQLESDGVIRSKDATRIAGYFLKAPSNVGTGTYEVAPGMRSKEIFDALRSPIRQMVRVPETNWARRTANLLAKKSVLDANEYLTLIKQPAEFQKDVSFPLPKDTLEGYLYPDTYDLPPLIGARAVIVRQLKTFQRKVWEGLKQPKNLHELIIKASLVEMETGTDEDRSKIAGVIDNRLAKKMKLQIDAALLYGIQKWRRLTFKDYRTNDSPYNLYKIDGLPPTPICSPSLKSVEAVLNPAKHDALYYVALPDGTSLFASTFDEHKHNIKKRLDALKQQGSH